MVTLQSRGLLLKYHDGLKMHLGRPVISWAFHKADTDSPSPSKAKIGLAYWIQHCIGSDLSWTGPSQVSFVSCNSLTCIPATVGIGGLQNLPGAELCSVAPLLINIQCFLSSYKTKPLLKSVLQTFTPRYPSTLTWIYMCISKMASSPFVVITSVFLLSLCFHSCCFLYWPFWVRTPMYTFSFWGQVWIFMNLTPILIHPDCPLGESDCPLLWTTIVLCICLSVDKQ